VDTSNKERLSSCQNSRDFQNSFHTVKLPNACILSSRNLSICSEESSKQMQGKKIISFIRLPKEYDPYDLSRNSLELSIPSCSECEIIYPTYEFSFWKHYLAVFPRQDLIDEIEEIDLDLPTELELIASDELYDGTPFEGLPNICVINRKRWAGSALFKLWESPKKL